jgi:hypothetical protein
MFLHAGSLIPKPVITCGYSIHLIGAADRADFAVLLFEIFD